MVAIVYTTVGNMPDARKIAKTLVEEQIVACVNIIPKIESYYRWNGKIENDEEVVLISKTTDANVKKTIQRIKQLHSYDLPDIILLPLLQRMALYILVQLRALEKEATYVHLEILHLISYQVRQRSQVLQVETLV